MFDDVLLAQSAVDRFKNAAYDFVVEGTTKLPASSASSGPCSERSGRRRGSLRCL
jgi:hypothetical protein